MDLKTIGTSLQSVQEEEVEGEDEKDRGETMKLIRLVKLQPRTTSHAKGLELFRGEPHL